MGLSEGTTGRMMNICNGCGCEFEFPKDEEYCDECAGINRRIPPKLMTRIAKLEARIKKLEDQQLGLAAQTDTVYLGPKRRIK
jgi:hypothetical protein